ncbi:NADPH:quinone reductase-like Zn-dependent oxidoreductase [Stackebrandtia albiflava]|uniref:NADPH:quinone reductase-like Zn-dependent oxidoreductase n=2 Tax=Stackebrandtia albiflava TaxID=406432 RepID=A0A562VBU3_9ACTN|nr:NADP-dependent oxidoreductase [Stackebrandtia albiflava]TWJ15355.1 NADPH:quinone reductase-like Zn-dependent oxidoreductase [Stackebrandtia albiflava]
MTLSEYGAALRLTEVPDPKVGPSEVRIRVKAAGVNPVDWKLASGGLDPVMEVGFPLISGWDVAGIVSDVGADVPEFDVGDEVFGYIRKDWAQFGAYAELVTANVRMLARKPAALDWRQAAGLPLAGLTAHRSLRLARVSEGDTVLIHAAAGGVGSLGTQIAVAAGAKVIGTASPANHEFLADLGATPVEYGDGLVERVRGLAPGGIDAVLDFVGGGVAADSVGLLSDPSRLVSIADPQAAELGGHWAWVRPDADGLTELAALAESGDLTVHVAESYPLAEAGKAWEASRTGHTRGKIVLTVD